MTAARAFQPTYEGLRSKLIAGEWIPGTRLEMGKLADAFHVSITPVRDSLNRLLGERLVELAPHIGFIVPKLDTEDLMQLIGWHAILVNTALAHVVGFTYTLASHETAESPIARATHFFGAIARDSANPEIEWAIRNSAARLGPYRAYERHFIADAENEIANMHDAAANGQHDQLAHLVERYHDRRRILASKIVAISRINTSESRHKS
jgi:DNA-binding GntR family transcriptional regulator